MFMCLVAFFAAAFFGTAARVLLKLLAPTWPFMKQTQVVVGLLTFAVVMISWLGALLDLKLFSILYRKFIGPWSPLAAAQEIAISVTTHRFWKWLSAISAFALALLLTLAFKPEGQDLALRMNWSLNWVRNNVYWLWFLVTLPALQTVWRLTLEATAGNTLKRRTELLDELHEMGAQAAHKYTAILEECVQDMNGLDQKLTRLRNEVADQLRISFIAIAPGDAEARVRVFRVSSNQIGEEICRQPIHEAPQTSIEVIQDPRSTASRAVRAKDIIVIDDLQVDQSLGKKSQYWPSPDEKPRGSLICCPVMRRNARELIAVICIKSEVPNVFSARNKRFYKRQIASHADQLILADIIDETHASNT